MSAPPSSRSPSRWVPCGLSVRCCEDGLVLLASTISAITVFLLIVYLRRTYSAMRWMAIGVALAASVQRVSDPVQRLHLLHQHGWRPPRLQAAVDRAVGIRAVPARGRGHVHVGRLPVGGRDTRSCWSTPIRHASCPTTAVTRRSSWTGRAKRRRRSGDYQMMAPNEVLPILDSLATVNFGSADSPVRIQSFRRGGGVAAALRVRQRRRRHRRPRRRRELSRRRGIVGRSGRHRTRARIHQHRRRRQLRAFPHQRELAHAAAAACSAWNFAFALFSVALSFGAGLAVSLLFEGLPGTRLIRALLIVPWPIPVLVSVLIWRSLLNPEQGMIGEFLSSVFGTSPQFFLDAKWTTRRLDPRQHLAVVPVLLRRHVGGLAGDTRRVSTTPPRSTAPVRGNASATSRSHSCW